MHKTMASPISSRSRSSSASSFDEAYFSKTYIPLSNLPTPPLSSDSKTRFYPQHSPEILISGEFLEPDLIGPATHLTNLIPSSTSLTSPCVPLVQALLSRSKLPLETIALAVCILDSLNSRFALTWRQGCPLVSGQHIDSIHPELIVLSALILAVKFLDDRQQVTREYAASWARGLWSCDQINFTQRCVLENLGYRLLPLWNESIIMEALEDMERAGRQTSPEIGEDDDWDGDTCFGSFGGKVEELRGGMAVMGLGHQLTPVETSMAENARGTRDLQSETKKAFKSGIGYESQHFHLTERHGDSIRETFPMYVDPILEGLGLGR